MKQETPEEVFTYKDMRNDLIENQISILQGIPTSKKDQEEKFINVLNFNSHSFTEVEVGLLKCNFCGYSIPFKPIPKNVEFCKTTLELMKNKNMKTVLVTYKEYQDAPHPLLDGEWIEKSKIVKVADLLELNDMFQNIINTKILD